MKKLMECCLLKSEKDQKMGKLQEKFKSFVAKAFKRTLWNPEVDENMLVWDWKIWLTPYLRSLKRFKDFHAFRFTLNQEHDPVFMYNNSILEHTWIGFQGSLVDG
jgi:hypothetical protein